MLHAAAARIQSKIRTIIGKVMANNDAPNDAPTDDAGAASSTEEKDEDPVNEQQTTKSPALQDCDDFFSPVEVANDGVLQEDDCNAIMGILDTSSPVDRGEMDVWVDAPAFEEADEGAASLVPKRLFNSANGEGADKENLENAVDPAYYPSINDSNPDIVLALAARRALEARALTKKN